MIHTQQIGRIYTAQPPKGIKALTKEGGLQITWEEDHVGHYLYKPLRTECRCANCVDEWTGQRRINPADIPEDIHIKNMSLAGNYALKIEWSDGHNTGMFGWELLRELCPCSKCKSGSVSE